MNKKEKIIGIVLSSLLFLCIVFLIIFTSEKSENRLRSGIIIQGADVLPGNEYLKFSLINKGNLNELSLFEIRQRFLPHKYILNADVEITVDDKVVVHLEEKSFIATLVSDGKTYLVSDKKDLTEVLENTNTLDLPAISNVRNSPKSRLKEPVQSELIEAEKIINATKLVNEKLYKELSEINMREGGEIVLTFSHLSMPILFGRKNILDKIVTLNSIENRKDKFSSMLKNSVYLDLRYEKNVFIGYNEVIGIN